MDSKQQISIDVKFSQQRGVKYHIIIILKSNYSTSLDLQLHVYNHFR